MVTGFVLIVLSRHVVIVLVLTRHDVNFTEYGLTHLSTILVECPVDSY